MPIPFRFPLRFKILVALLFLVTAVVSLITFTMANLFHTDKKTYIHDLTSVIALHTAEEARSLLIGYRERIKVFSRLLYDERLPQARKIELLKSLFEDFGEFVAVTRYEGEAEQATLYDAARLSAAGLTARDLIAFRRAHPLPFARIHSGEVFVENSTLSERLPTMTIAVVPPMTSAGGRGVVAAVVSLDSLQRLVRRSTVFETLLVDGQGVLLAHTDPKQVALRTVVDWLPRPTAIQGRQSLGTTLEYTHRGVEIIAGFAQVEFSGVLAVVQIPKTAAYLTARELLDSLIGVALLLLVVAAVLGLVWARLITRPIERFSMATRVVAKGEFDIQLAQNSRDEIGMLAGSFNQMTAELKVREAALKHAQAALIQSEKMAAFGQLGAGIAHEVKNPLAGILGYAQLAMRKMEKGSATYMHIETIEKETRRCKTIIENLLRFARQEKAEFALLDLNQTVEESIVLVDHQLTINQVSIEKRLSPVPRILGNANQLQQVMMNLMINAQQAMEPGGGKVTVATRPIDGAIELRVADTGPGIPREIQSRIFEPFFTTKPAGTGTGLGLSVTYGIVHDHRGAIRIESEPGQGASFVLTFPAADGAPAPPGPPSDDRSG